MADVQDNFRKEQGTRDIIADGHCKIELNNTKRKAICAKLTVEKVNCVDLVRLWSDFRKM